MLTYFDWNKVWQSRISLSKNKSKHLSLKFLAVALRQRNGIMWVYAATLWFTSELNALEDPWKRLPIFWELPINLMLFEIIHSPVWQKHGHISEISQWQIKSAFQSLCCWCNKYKITHLSVSSLRGSPCYSNLIPSLFAFPHKPAIKICWFFNPPNRTFPSY